MRRLYPIGTKLVYTKQFKAKLFENQSEYSKECMDVYNLPYVTVENHFFINKSNPDPKHGLMELKETGGKWGGDAFEIAPEPVVLPEELFEL